MSFSDPSGLGLACGHNSDEPECPRSDHNGDGVPDKGGTKPATRVAAVAPKVEDPQLKRVLDEIYAKPHTEPAVGSGKVGEALIHELEKGTQVRERWHVADAADQLNRLVGILEDDRKSDVVLTAGDRTVALNEAQQLWNALDTKDKAGKVTEVINNNKAIASNIRAAAKLAIEAPSMASITGSKFGKPKMWQGKEVGRPKVISTGKIPRLVGALGVAGDALFFLDGLRSIVTGEANCMLGCPVPQEA